MKITFPVPVPLNAQYRFRTQNGRMYQYMTMEAKRWMKKAHSMIVEDGILPIEGPVKVSINWYRARRSGDVDGRFKLLLDVLQARHKKWMVCGCGGGFGAYLDDAQIDELHMYRYEDKKNPRMEVTVESNV